MLLRNYLFASVLLDGCSIVRLIPLPKVIFTTWRELQSDEEADSFLIETYLTSSQVLLTLADSVVF